MKLSKFANFIEIEKGVHALFNSLFLNVLFVDDTKKKQIEKLRVNDSEKKVLLENGIYVNRKSNDEKVFQVIKNNIVEHSKKISIMYLNLSTYCNLACKYCFIDNNPLSVNDRRIMTFETAKNALEKFKEEIIKNNEESIAQIILYGGEPLTNSQNFEKIITYARQILPKIKITLITNGTLLNEEIIKFLRNNSIIIGLSIDGPKCINDKYRIFKSSKESVFDNETTKIKLLNKLDCQYGLSSTVTPDLIKHKDETISCFRNLKVHDVFFNLYHYSSKTKENDWQKFYLEMSEFILQMNDDLKKIDINEGRIRDQINLIVKEIFKFQSCGAVGLNQITIQPNGDVCICQGDSRSSKQTIGNINLDKIEEMIHSPKVAQWQNYYTVCRKECKYCEAIFVCGGGCPLQAEALFGSRKLLDKPSCIFYKKFLRWYLQKYYLKIKGGKDVNCSES